MRTRATNGAGRARRVVGVTAAMLLACGSAMGAPAALPAATGVTATVSVIATEAGVGEMIGDRMARFFASESAKSAAQPSYALDRPWPGQGPVGAGIAIRPEFSEADGKSVAVVKIEAGTSLYGTGEVPGPLQRNGRRAITWNTDAYGYKDQTLSLYQSHPWVLGVRGDGTSFGVLADTTWRTEIDLRDGIRFVSDGPAFPVIVIERGTPQEVVSALAELTGRMPMPPKWAVGFHQCRYSYYPEARVREIAREFRQRKIPCDVIWFDIHYMDEFRTFQFNKERFPDPKKLNADLLAQGFHNVWMINPGVKAEPGFFVYDQLMAGDHAVKKADGSVYQGEVWPGMCVFPDYTDPKTRAWWATLYKDFMAQGVTGVWNDMNEPAIFNVTSKTMPEDNLHRGDPSLATGPTGPGTHARFHNVFGMQMVKATREGIQAANPDKRPFVLSRANYIGGQRYAAMWTGDNAADWYDLEASVPMVLNMGLSGQPFAGPDIGGFIGDGTPEMFARWMGFGAMLPFARAHTDVKSRDKEPWAFGPEVEATCRQAIENRYILMPFYYTLFHEAHATGLPVARPLFFHDPKDPALRTEDDAFLIGSDLLVVPQLTPHADRAPVMPRGDWRPLALQGADNPDIPKFYTRAGSIIPSGPIVQHTGEKPLDPLTLIVTLDDAGRAEGRLYEDAGDGFGFQKGEYLQTTYTAQRQGDSLSVRVSKAEGSWPRPDRALRVRVLTPAGEFVGEGRDGQAVTVSLKK